MAHNYHPFSPSDVCVPATVDLMQNEFTVDSSWMAGAFFLGLFLGALLTAICVPFCLKDLEKKKRQEDEEAMMKELEQNQTEARLIREKTMGVKVSIKGRSIKSGKGGRKVVTREVEEEGSEEEGKDGPPQVSLTDPGNEGLGKIMTNFHSEDAENEMMKQDQRKVEALMAALQAMKDQILFKMIRQHLKKFKVGEQPRSIVERNVVEDLLNRRKMLEDDRMEEEQAIKQAHVKDKDTTVMEDELEQLDAKTNQKLAQIYEEEKDFIRKEINKQTDLSEKDIDALMEKLMSELSEVDRKQALQLSRQQRALEERLAKRRQIIAMRKLQDQQEGDVVVQNVESHEDALKHLVQDGKLNEKKKNQLLNEYLQDLNRLTKARDIESQRQQLSLEEKLAKRRRREIQKLSKEQEREEQLLMKNFDKSTNTKGLVEDYLELKEKHQQEMAEKELQLDQEELQGLDKIRTAEAEVKEREIENQNDKMAATITETVGSEHKFDVDRLIKAHKQRMKLYEEERLEERNKFAARLKERLNQKMAKLEEEEEIHQQEQEAMVVQQTATVNRVLTTSLELTDEAKEKILREHEQNLQVINNQLQVSRLKQQKNLESKLAERRARMAEVRRKKEETLMNKAKANLEEREKIQQQLDVELQLEEKKLEDERRSALDALRRRMALETQEALRDQERRLGQMIGRLEVGAARRQAILSKQDATLQQLQEQLENKLSREGSRLSGVDAIIQQHSSQVDQLNDQLQRAREQQESLIKERIKAKKHQKEMELQEQIEEEEDVNRKNSIRRRGAGKASNILNTVFMEQHHRKQRQELESEMKVELDEQADPALQESLQSENVPGEMEGEQTWPTEEEMEEAEAALKAKTKLVKKVPKGTSEYQAAWIVDSEEEEIDDDESDDEEDMEDEDMMAMDDSGSESGDGAEFDTLTMTEAGDVANYDQTIDMEEEERMLEKIKEERNHVMFPDEIDTPRERDARDRFQRYRGLKSFRTSPWDPKENLPSDFARIFQFKDFRRTKKRIMKGGEEDGVMSGWFVQIHIANVPKDFMLSYKPGMPVVIFGLLQHEHKMSVLNFLLKRVPEYRPPIKSKDRLIFHVGFRRYSACPIFSQHTNANKHKFERFLAHDTVTMATIFGPISFPPCPVLVFKEQHNGQHELIATGSLHSANPDRIVTKRIVLSGHPFKINKRSAVVRYMFFNREDIEWFKPVELHTKWGRRGHIREPLGTHGHMKCVFDGHLKSQDTVLMNLYKRMFPKWTYNPTVLNPPPMLESSQSMASEPSAYQLFDD